MPDLDTLELDELDELRGVWLDRLMFNMFVGWPPETRSFEQFAEDAIAARAAGEADRGR